MLVPRVRRTSLITIVKRAIGSTVVTFALAVAAYTVSPFATAMVLSNAIKTSNVSLMDTLVDWQGVRTSLRATILQRLDEQALARPEHHGFLDSVKFTLTDTFGPYMVDRMLNERVSPAGFTLYMGPNSPQAMKVRATGIDPDTLPSADTLKRIRNATFIDLRHFQIEMIDRWDPGRVYLAVLERNGFLWRLARVDMLALGAGT
jgi:Protein of unknown function (DUF2939)